MFNIFTGIKEGVESVNRRARDYQNFLGRQKKRKNRTLRNGK